MTLLAPAAAILAGALALPALILLYLLRLRRRPVRVSTIRFWPRPERDAQANVPLAFVRPSWLLLLHLLALGCAVIAVGRPALHESGLGDRVVLVLDVSASMSARDELAGPSRLERAKILARRRLSELSRGRTQIAVVSFAARARLETGFTSSRSAAQAAVDAAQPTDQPGNLASAWELLRGLAGNGEETAAPRALLFSDGAFREMPPSAPLAIRHERIGPAAGTPPPPNIGIVAFASQRAPDDPGAVRFFAELLSTGPETDLVLTLSAGQRFLARQPVHIPAAAPPTPARKSVVFDLRIPEGGAIRAAIPGGDALACDDAAALVLPPAQRPAVWLIRPEFATQPLPPGSMLLEDALRELRLASLDVLTPSDFTARVASGAWERANLLILDRVPGGRLPPIPSVSFGAAPVLDAALVLPEAGPAAEAVFWQRRAPLLRGLSLDSLVVARTLRFSFPDPARMPEALVDGPTGPLLLDVDDRGTRRLVVAFDLSDSNWPVQPAFPVFLANAADALTFRGRGGEGLAFTTGELIRLDATGPGDITLALPGANRPALSVAAGEVGAVSLGPATLAGVYTLTGPARDRAVAVNLTDAVESALESPDEVQASGRPVSGMWAGKVPREIWHWFVLAAILILMVEWLVYGLAVRA